MRLPCTERVDAPEWIDSPDTSLAAIRATLRDQAVVNRWLGGARATLAHALPLIRQSRSDPVRVLDAACGGADVSRALVDHARRWGKRIEVVGLDLNEKALASARPKHYPEISFVRGDALQPPFAPGAFDVVILATFLHHLPPEGVARALRVAGDLSRDGVVAADLVRSPLAWLGIKLFAPLARFHPVSAHDGAVSICRAYTPVELAELARRAGLEHWRICRHRFYRMVLVYGTHPLSV